MDINLKLTLDAPRGWARRVILYVGTPIALVAATALVAYATVPNSFKTGDKLSAAKVNENFTTVDARVTTLEGAQVKPVFFSWTVVAPPSGVDTYPIEGTQTIAFAQAGNYRVTLNTHVIHDIGTTATVTWVIAGSATRLDPFTLDSGANVIFIQKDPEGRLVESTALFVKATAGQTLTLRPILNVIYSSGNFHLGQFMYAAEYVGP